jgi:hypothetical protein
MDELDENELFTVCLADDGHPVQRAVRDMTAGEVIAAIDHLTAGSTRIAVREKLARLRQVVAQSTPDRAEAGRAGKGGSYWSSTQTPPRCCQTPSGGATGRQQSRQRPLRARGEKRRLCRMPSRWRG